MLEFIFPSILLSFAFLLFTKILLSSSNKTKLPPSPLALPFIGHFYLFKETLHHSLARISQRYGPITFLRFGNQPVLVISSRSLAEKCFTTHDVAFADRPQVPSQRGKRNFTGIAGAKYGPYWRSLRRIATVELLSAQSLHASSDARAGEVRDLARQLFISWKASSRSMGANGMKKVELKTSLFQLSLNVVMRMIAGKRFYGDNIEDLEETIRFREAVEESFILSGAANIEDFIPILTLLDLKGVIKRKAHLAKHHKEMIAKLVEEHRRNISTEMKKTMIAVLLELQKKDPEEYNDQKITDMCLSFLLAGTDTTSNTVEWAMSLLLNNPEVLKKAFAEIDKNVGSDRLIEESDLADIPYLQCILSETLRLYPGAPILVPHLSREDVSIGGYNIPNETMLLVNAYHIHRDPDAWDEPTKFKPERFENGKGEGKLMIPFGMGRRRCPGEGLAMREVGLMLGTLVQCFDWERTGYELVDVTEGFGLTLPKAIPLEALYRPRESMVKVLSEL